MSGLLHTIRLRGPWQYRVLAVTSRTSGGESVLLDRPLPPAGRQNMPSDWGASLGVGFRGRVQYSRSFGCPTGLASSDRVVLAFQAVDAFGQIALNGDHVGDIPPGLARHTFDITKQLQRRNRLDVEVELPEMNEDAAPLDRGDRDGLPGGLTGDVLLEIHARD